jgi:putative phage-type endonuclease
MRRIVKLDQGTEEWLAWRSGGIGGSDAPIILGVSPWTSARELWERKTGRTVPPPPNAAMERGRQMEPVARRAYERQTGHSVLPLCMEHATHRWMRASLDGITSEGEIALEIKCPGRVDHGTALEGRVPEKYMPQLQHLLAVSDAEVCHYWSFREGRGVLLEVLPDRAYIESLIRAEAEFWDCVLRDVPPVQHP